MSCGPSSISATTNAAVDSLVSAYSANRRFCHRGSQCCHLPTVVASHPARLSPLSHLHRLLEGLSSGPAQTHPSSCGQGNRSDGSPRTLVSYASSACLSFCS